MKLLNLACGGTRNDEPYWTHVDILHSIFPKGTIERQQLDGEPNYVNADITKPLPFLPDQFDGVLASHVIEHFDAPQGLAILRECHRMLRVGGDIIVSVPNASYFRKVFPDDRNANWPRLFGTTDPNNPIPTFFEAALWFNEHKAILTEDAVWAYLQMAGFQEIELLPAAGKSTQLSLLASLLNREILSVTMCARKLQ